MLLIKRLSLTLGIILLCGAVAPPLAAKTHKGDKLLTDGKVKEFKKDWDGALDLYEQALATDPSDPFYQLCVDRARFQAGQAHVTLGLKIRTQGNLTQALIEFQKAYQIDPASSVAETEIRRTREMINREKKKAGQPGVTPEDQAEEAGLTPAQAARKESEKKLSTILPVPELKPLNKEPINLTLRNQPPKVLFETVGKIAGINVLFDQDFIAQNNKPMSIDITSSTLEEALYYLSVLTKAFWKPLSGNTIFVTQESTTKRRDYEEQVMKVFYLQNVNTPQELQEIVTSIRSVADLQRLFVYNAQNAIIARGEADRIALAEKIIQDLDKPKPEVIVDIIVMEADRTRSRSIAINAINGGLNVPITFTGGSTSTTTTVNSTNNNSNTNTLTASTTTTPTTSAPLVPLNQLKFGTGQYSVTLPSGLLEAMMSDSTTRILQTPQVRAVDGAKADLKIGQKVPTASGSFQPGIGGVGINPLVNTQFTYIDVGVNVNLTPHIHDNEVDMHVEVEISSVASYVNLGGISEPVIGQHKIAHDIRMKEGEINLLGGLMQIQDTRTKAGIPGLSNIPLLGRLFTSDTVERDTQDLVIAIVPHIVRRPEITAENLRTSAVGNQTTVSLRYGPKPGEVQKAPQPAPAPGPNPPVPAALPIPGTPVVTPPVPPPAPATQPATTPPPAPPPAPAAADQPKASVVFSPAQLQTTVGGTIQVTFVVNNAADLFSMPLTFKFDPKIVRLSDVIRGPVLGSDGNIPAFTKNIQNDSGEARISLSRMYGRPGVMGNGTLLTLVFQGVERGSTTVTLPQVGLRDSKGGLIPLQSEQPPQATITVQ